MFRLLFVFVLVCLEVVTGDVNTVIKNLVGEPDYRTVRLYWNSPNVPSNGFQVKYCELQSWGTQKCRTKLVKEPMRKVEDADDDLQTFETEVDGLRMATNYSFEIKQAGREDRSDDKNQSVIVLPTKGFSARATLCLPESSEIEVSTGPYFGGRIAVEAADGERCGLDGIAGSPRDTYTLRINHKECGSHVNETTVSTFVLVQENLPILTHSTRRFLVLCTFQPETLTVRANLNLPSAGRGQAFVDHEDMHSYWRRARNMRFNRIFEMPEALVRPKETVISTSPPEKKSSLPVTVIILLVVAGIGALVAVSSRWQLQADDDMDTVSVESEVSVSSIDTTLEIDNADNNDSTETQKKEQLT